MESEIQRRVHKRIQKMLMGRTQSWLSEESGVHISTLNNAINRGSYTLALLERIAPALGTTVADLVRAPRSQQVDEQLALAGFDRIAEVVDVVRERSADGSTGKARSLGEDVVNHLPGASGVRGLQPEEEGQESSG